MSGFMWMSEPMEVDLLPTKHLITFIQQHQKRLAELQEELIVRVKLQEFNLSEEEARSDVSQQKEVDPMTQIQHRPEGQETQKNIP